MSRYEWSNIEKLIPPAKRGGNKRTVDVREVVNGMMYVLEHRLPVGRDAEGSAAAQHGERLFLALGLRRDARSHPPCLYVQCRERLAARPARRPRSSTAKASRAQKRGASIDPPGFDAGKKIKGKKRHILVDTQGLLMHAIVHAADIQDRDGGVSR